MRKAEIIAKVVKEADDCDSGESRWTGPGHTYPEFVEAGAAKRLERLAHDLDVRTCEDFAHIGLACCPVCHKEYPDEQGLVELETGGTAWVSCAIERALLMRKGKHFDPAGA